MLGEKAEEEVRGETGVSLSIMTMSPWSDRMGEAQPMTRLLLKEASSSSDRFRLSSMVGEDAGLGVGRVVLTDR